MVTLLAKIFIKDSEDKIKQREAYGMLCGVIGILFNVLLFIGKFLAELKQFHCDHSRCL